MNVRSGSDRILVVVDDEPVIRDVMSAIFSGESYRVVICADGAEALRAFERDGVDVLLTDKNLPDVNGLELVRRARSAQADVEAIVFTGYASLDTALQAVELGVFDYIVKPPADIFDVRRKVERAFDRQALSRENRALVEDLRSKNTELEQALAQLRAAQAELVQAEKLAGIGTLAAGIAHEVSSPLFGVMGLAEAITDEDDLDTIRSHATEIVEYSKVIKEIIHGLTGYARSASDDGAPCDLAKAAGEAVKLVRLSADVDGVEWSLDLEPGVEVVARPNELQQIFVNLAKNAVDALREASVPDPHVVVRVGSQDGLALASVADNGPGIPAERQALIFDPFYTTKPPGQGTGLGLNIVYRIVTCARGSIAVESVPGAGAKFSLQFPRYR